MEKVLVTGGTGFIGYHLVHELLNKGYDVTVIDNLFRSQIDQECAKLLKNVEFKSIDLSAPIDNKLSGSYKYVFHLAAINGVKYAEKIPDVVLKTNILSTINILEWCKNNKPDSFIFASSSEVYSGAEQLDLISIPTNEKVPLVISDTDINRQSYAGSKLAGELLTLNYAKQHQFKSRILRYHNIYGPRMGFDHVIPEVIMRTLKNENPMNAYGANQTRAFCYISDAIEATIGVGLELEDPHLTVNIGNSGEETPIRNLYETITKMVGNVPELNEKSAPLGSVNRRCPDVSLLEGLIGYSPKISLQEGLIETINWYKNYSLQ
ncbi:NAD-dependent epimerase/dehydratase family protein [Cytobacillus oceanisediminis]|uniref:NAD-dependent epimerase/dehydratase family protein n=1 Tax=Cytobacillus oceanisediminis TaxID=665099 RepID=UPI001C21990A|nr:NAD-dependent epimerase/dehydratase family protein [Cytobacillus oceanisediminis]MBU8772086.1 NAD-dependent epimerase/dehydratase family protein [Cytobacillus oceanisediminis]